MYVHCKYIWPHMFPKKKDAFDVEETKSALGEFVKEYVISDYQ